MWANSPGHEYAFMRERAQTTGRSNEAKHKKFENSSVVYYQTLDLESLHRTGVDNNTT